MGVKITNNASGTLSAAITSSATTLTLTSGQGALFPTLGAGDYCWCTLVDTSNNVEIIKVTARSTDTMTIVRGQDNTTAQAFAINDRLELRPTAALFNEFANPEGTSVLSTGETGATKFLRENGDGTCSWITVTSNSTAKGLYEHSNTISANYTIASGNNAVSAGEIQIDSGVTVEIPSGSFWVIV